jgi:hypothetical protein
MLLVTIGVALGASLFLTGGCTPPGENLVTAGKVVVNKQSLGRVRVSRAEVYQDGETVVVDCNLRHPGAGHYHGTMGHMDVAVLGPDGVMLAQKSSSGPWLNCNGHSFLRTRLPLVAPEGSTVRVLFHDSRTVPTSGHTPEEWEALWKTAPRT